MPSHHPPLFPASYPSLPPSLPHNALVLLQALYTGPWEIMTNMWRQRIAAGGQGGVDMHLGCFLCKQCRQAVMMPTHHPFAFALH